MTLKRAQTGHGTATEDVSALVGIAAPANTSVSANIAPAADAATAAENTTAGDEPNKEDDPASEWDTEAIQKWICNQPDNPKHYAPMIKSILKTATRLSPTPTSMNLRAFEDALDEMKVAQAAGEQKK